MQVIFGFGRPMILSNIGGVAERMKDGVDGLQFGVGNNIDIAVKMECIGKDDGVWDKLQRGIKRTTTSHDGLVQMLPIYKLN